MKRLLVVSLFALASLLLVPSALSDPPTIQRFPIDATFLDTVDCAFPVQIDVVGTDLEITSGNRVFDAFPQSTATLTNLDTRTSITVSIAGPGHTTLGADERHLRGHGSDAVLLPVPPGQSANHLAQRAFRPDDRRAGEPDIHQRRRDPRPLRGARRLENPPPSAESRNYGKGRRASRLAAANYPDRQS